MCVYVPPFLTLLLYAPTGALFHDGAYPGSETNTKPPEMSSISAGLAEPVVFLTNATFPSVATSHQNKVKDSTAFSVKIFEPPPSKHTEREPPMGVLLMEPTGRNNALSPSPTLKPQGDITLPPMDQKTELKTSTVTSSIILSSTTGITNIPPELTKNIIDVATTTLYTHRHQETSQLISSLSTPTQANTALPVFTTDWESTRPSDTIIQSTTKGVTNIQPRFTKIIIDVADTTVYNYSPQPISSLSSPTSKSQANTAVPGFTTDWGSTRPTDTIIPSITIGVTSIQPRFTKNIINIADTTVYNHSPQPISTLSSPTSKSQGNTALPRFTTDWGLTRPSDTIIPLTTKGVISSIQPRFTKNIINVADTTVYNHSPQPRNSLSSPTSKSQANTAVPGFTTDWVSTRPSDTIIPSTSKGVVSSIQPVFTKNIIDAADTTVYNHRPQPTSSLSSPTSKTQANTALPGFTTDWGSTGPSDTITPSTTKGVSSIQPRFTKNIINVADTTVYNHSPQPISSLLSPTSKSQANTALSGFTTDWGSTRPSDTIIPSTTKGITSIQPRFTKNIIDVADTTVNNHSPQPISSLSSPTSKSQANTALPGFTTDQGSTGPSGTIIPSTTIRITSIQPRFTTDIIDVAHTAVYTYSHQETSQLMSSSYIPTTSIPSSSMSAPAMCITTASTMQETTRPTNDILTTTTEDTTTAPLRADKTPPTILPLNSKISDPKPPSMTLAKTSVSFNSNNPSTMLPAITSTGKTFNVTGSWSPEKKSVPIPHGTWGTPMPYSVTPQSSQAPKRSTYSRINLNTSSTIETTEEQSLEVTETGEENTLHPKITMSNSGGRMILRVTLDSSPSTNFAVAMRELLQRIPG
ncbi:uncharacterized protein [Phyllobates terribilis]|uniref:uncharacterized protein isoform X2 n=1 Tax=Phyllobates terribilis TaxID=111132 RepID=UPI003CCA6E8F